MLSKQSKPDSEQTHSQSVLLTSDNNPTQEDSDGDGEEAEATSLTMSKQRFSSLSALSTNRSESTKLGGVNTRVDPNLSSLNPENLLDEQ